MADTVTLPSHDGASAPKLQIRLKFEPAAGAAMAATADPPAAAAAENWSAISMADGILAEAEPLLVCSFGAGRLGLGFDKKSVPPLAVMEVDPTLLAADFPMLVPGCVLRTVQGQPVRSLLHHPLRLRELEPPRLSSPRVPLIPSATHRLTCCGDL